MKLLKIDKSEKETREIQSYISSGNLCYRVVFVTIVIKRNFFCNKCISEKINKIRKNSNLMFAKESLAEKYAKISAKCDEINNGKFLL